MHNRVKPGLVLMGWGAVILAPFVSHVAITTGRFTALALALSALQSLTLAAVALRQESGWRRGLGVGAALALLAFLAWKVLGEAGRTGLIASSGGSHAIIYGSLLILFGQSLRPGRTALVTTLAQRIRGTLTPAMHSYTRTVTKAWCGFFLAQLVSSAFLFAVASDRVWSLFVNVLDGPLVAAMFLAEYAIRRWRFRQDRHHSPLAVARFFARDRAGG